MTLASATTTLSWSTEGGGSLLFDGVDDVAEVADSDALDLVGINEDNAIDTYAKTIKQLGIRRVKEVDSKFFPTSIFTTEPKENDRQVGQYYLKSQISTPKVEQDLKQIAGHLGIPLRIETPIKKKT